MQRLTTHEAKTHLSKLLGRVEQGEEFVICRGDVPVAKLTGVDPRESRRTRPKVGTITSGEVNWTEDAFAALDGGALADWGL